MDWWWGHGQYAEIFYGPFKTRDEAAADAVRQGAADITVCQADKMALHDGIFDAEQVFEQFEERNEEAWGEGGPEPHAITPDAERELIAALNAAFAAWRAKHQPWTAYCFGETANVEYVADARLLIAETPESTQ